MSDTSRDILQKKLIEIKAIAPVFRHVLDWCAKYHSSNISSQWTFKTLIDGREGKEYKKFAKTNSKDLDTQSCRNYDVSLLYSTIFYVCTKLAPFWKDESKNKFKDPKNIEYMLKEAKEWRNTLTHEYGTIISSNDLKDFWKTLEDVLQEAAKMYCIEDSTLKLTIDELRDAIISIGKETYDRDWMIKFIKETMRKEGIIELKKSFDRNNAGMNIPLNYQTKLNRKNVYSELSMTVGNEAYESAYPSENRNISVQQLVDCRPSKFIIVKGTPGAGKTVTLKHIMDLSLEKIESLREDIVVHVSCRTTNRTTMSGLLMEKLSKTLGFLDERCLTAAAAQMSITVIADGYDEANTNALELLKDILERNCPDWSLIISSRPEACAKLAYEFTKRGITSVTTVRLETLSFEEKIIFIGKYLQENPIESFEVDHLRAFPDIMKLLDRPFLLCLFYALLSKNKRNVCSIKNEGTLLSAAFIEISKEMSMKIKDSYSEIRNEDVAADCMLDIVSELSLQLFCSNEYFITRERYIDLKKRLMQSSTIHHAKEIDLDMVLSCILSPGDNDSYHLWHSTFQEYLSARFIVQQLQDKERSASESDANPIFEVIMEASNSSDLDKKRLVDGSCICV